jgi:hypothetical protein
MPSSMSIHSFGDDPELNFTPKDLFEVNEKRSMENAG